MQDCDKFASLLLEEAKRFLELASNHGSADGTSAYLHAAILVGFSALEAHVNSIADDFATAGNLTPHELAILKEQDVRLADGEFVLTNSLKIYRLEDRIQFIHRRFSGRDIDRSAVWWSELKSAMKFRNELCHPKGMPIASREAVERALNAIIDTLNAIFEAVFKAKFPAAVRGLQSRLDF